MVDETTGDIPAKGDGKISSSSSGTSSGFLGSIEEMYEDLIEKGKRKLGYYRPDVTENDRFLMSFLIYFTVLLMVVFTADYLAQKTYEDSNSLTPLQELEVDIIYKVQHDYFDMPVVVNRTSNTIWYDTNAEWRGQTLTQDEKIGGFGLEIASVCTGFHEMVFLGVLVLGFRGVPVKLRLKWAAILLSIVFVENLFRIFALYPLALYYGRDFEEWFHFYWWHYGQYAFIMGLFGLWFIFVARKYVNPEEYIEKERKREKLLKADDGKGKNEEPSKAIAKSDDSDTASKKTAPEVGKGEANGEKSMETTTGTSKGEEIGENIGEPTEEMERSPDKDIENSPTE
jgi:exosortase/archaeosortase family protein